MASCLRMDKASTECQGRPYRVRLAAGGRIVIPAEVRQELGVKEGDELILSKSDTGYRVSTIQQVVREAQAYFRQFKRDGESVVDEFLEERMEEAAKEDGGPGRRTGK